MVSKLERNDKIHFVGDKEPCIVADKAGFARSKKGRIDDITGRMVVEDTKEPWKEQRAEDGTDNMQQGWFKANICFKVIGIT